MEMRTMWNELRTGLVFTVVAMLVFGVGYHLALWSVGRVLFPARAEGSLIRSGNGTVIGSRLIAQKFTRPEYFQSRPSAVDFNAASTGGSNWGPSNPDHLAAVRERLDAVIALEGVAAGAVPSEMVTASGAGLDPHVPPAVAKLQAARVARARQQPVARIHALILASTESPTFGFLGKERVNVLELNLALDRELEAAPAVSQLAEGR
jgi:K+-transporting ATPase ATPase C chain